MSRGLRTHKTWRQLAGPLALAVLGLVQAAGAAETGTLFVYLEVPANYAVATELSVAEISASAGETTLDLSPRQRRFAAATLAGRQILLARADLPAAFYDSLTIVLSQAVVRSGTAEVRPPPAVGGETIALQADLRAGDAVVRRLVWQPGSLPEAGQPYHPAIQLSAAETPPLGALAIVSEEESGCVLYVDRLAGRVVAATRTGGRPRGLVYSSARQQLYVAQSAADGLSIIDVLTLRRVRHVTLGFGDQPERLALSPDEATLYVLNVGSRSLIALATRSMQERSRVRVGEGPRSLAVDPLTGRIYVACEVEGEVQVFGPDALQPLGALAGLGAPAEVLVAGETGELYVSSRDRNRVQGFGLSGNGELGNLSLCGPAHYLAFNRHARQLYAAIPACDEVSVLRPAEGFEFSPVAMPTEPGYLAFDRSFRQLLVVLPRPGELAIFEANRGTLASRVELGGTPYAVVVP